MKQVLQSLKDGQTVVADVPVPAERSGQILIRTSCSLVSAGTERMLVAFGKGNFVSKARQQPDKVREVFDKMRTDGVSATLAAVRSKLDQPITLGYCNVGRVAKTGHGVDGFKHGDRVVSNGHHAEFVSVPKNLCARIPDCVSDEAASFTVLSAIGLQGIRLAKPTLGECVVVTGLGLIGLVTVQILRAQGCRVLGIDRDPARLELARRFGAETVNIGAGEDPLINAHTFSRGAGVDAVLITASTKSNEPITQAAKMCRKRGRIVLVGVAGLELNRADFYEKELNFQVSCSYGPGRYDPAYEDRGQDYPIGFVRWTEQRNFEAVLDLMASGALNVEPLITHRFDVDEGAKAMELLTSEEPSLGIVLRFADRSPHELDITRTVSLNPSPEPSAGRVAFIGAGNYAGRILIPAFQSAGATLDTVVSSGGVSAVHFGKKFGFSNASTDTEAVFENRDIDTVVVATRHNAHADQVLAALKSGKHIFCEKPLCLTLGELEEIETEARARPEQHLMVGFNRRFAPQVIKMKELLATLDAPKNFILTVNAGDIPADHWTQDLEVGGRRIIGEGCHFVDLLRHLAGAPIENAHGICLGEHPSLSVRDDKAVITIQFQDGSVGVINYLANGHKAVSKERLEVFVAGRVLQLDNFLRLSIHGWNGAKKSRLWKQDKGQDACAAAFINAVKAGEDPPIPLDEIIEISRVSIELGRNLI